MCVLSRFSHVCDPMDYSLPAPLSMGFSRQEYWSGLPFPPPGDLSNPGVDPRLLCLLHCQVGSLPLVPPGIPRLRVVRLYSWLLLPLEHKRHFQAFFRVDWSHIILSSSTSPLDHCLSYLLYL